MIEPYEPSVQRGNHTPLDTARVPFALYINVIHERLHPHFEKVVASLDTLPRAQFPNGDLVAHVEIVIAKDDGRIIRLGIIKASGARAFDLAALDAVNRAQPFGPAPDVIASPGGNVYVHWELHRDPEDACSPRNAKPFLLTRVP